jgi:hypothetical protein
MLLYFLVKRGQFVFLPKLSVFWGKNRFVQGGLGAKHHFIYVKKCL